MESIVLYNNVLLLDDSFELGYNIKYENGGVEAEDISIQNDGQYSSIDKQTHKEFDHDRRLFLYFISIPCETGERLQQNSQRGVGDDNDEGGCSIYQRELQTTQGIVITNVTRTDLKVCFVVLITIAIHITTCHLRHLNIRLTLRHVC